MLWPIFTFLSLPWLVLAAAYSLGLMWLLNEDLEGEEDRGLLDSGLATLGFVAVWALFGDMLPAKAAVPGLLAEYGTKLALGVAAQFVCGTIFMILYWWLVFRARKKQKYKKFKVSWLEKNQVYNTETVPESLKPEFTKALLDYYDYPTRCYPYRHDTGLVDAKGRPIEEVRLWPLATDNKARCVSWMLFWEWKALSYVGWHAMKDLGNAIFNRVSGFMNYLSSLGFRDVANDVVRPQPVPAEDPVEVVEEASK